MLFYVIAYDIPCNKRRNKIANLLEGYGDRVQYSVFECVLTKDKYKELRQRLRKLFKKGEDSLMTPPAALAMFLNSLLIRETNRRETHGFF